VSNRAHRRPDHGERHGAGDGLSPRRSFGLTDHDPLTIEGRIEQYGLMADGVRRCGPGRVLLWLFVGVVAIFVAVVVVALIVSALP
jgi:hypothetical protein